MADCEPSQIYGLSRAFLLTSQWIESHPTAESSFHPLAWLLLRSMNANQGRAARFGGGESMKHNVEFKHFEPYQKTRNLIEELVKKLDKRTKRFPPDEVFLRLLIEENPVRKLYHVSLTLEIPGKSPATKKTLATKEERHDLIETLRDAFDEIERQLEAYKSTLLGEPIWKRPSRREELRRMKGK
jgi:ribosome-associated translation inhibitor RaiA